MTDSPEPVESHPTEPPPPEVELGPDEVQPAEAEPAEAEPEERRYPSTLGGLLYLFMLGGAATGVLVAWAGDWRAGVRLLALSLVFGAGSRAVVPPAQAGMLRVRHRMTDVVLLTAVAVILFLLVGSIPD